MGTKSEAVFDFVTVGNNLDGFDFVCARELIVELINLLSENKRLDARKEAIIQFTLFVLPSSQLPQ